MKALDEPFTVSVNVPPPVMLLGTLQLVLIRVLVTAQLSLMFPLKLVGAVTVIAAEAEPPRATERLLGLAAN